MPYSSTIPIEKIIGHLQIENPWWKTNAIQHVVQIRGL
jgi:hypothetical protein